MGLLQDIQPYLDPQTHMVCPDRGSTGCDNMILFSAELFSLLTDKGEKLLVKTTIDKYLADTRMSRGIYSRKPAQIDDQNSVDNYIAIVYASPEAAKDIQWAAHYGWDFDTNLKKDSIDSWFGRFIGFSSFVRLVNGERRFVDDLMLSASMLFTLFGTRTDVSNKCLQVLINRKIQENLSPLTELSLDIWKFVMGKRYKGGLSELYALYFRDDKHPLSIHAPKHWDL